MLRRLILGAAIVAAFAGLSPAVQQPPTAAASPANQLTTVQFASTVTPGGESVLQAGSNYFSSDTHIVWAVVNFAGLAPGTKLTYVLRLNGGDYTYGDFADLGNRTSGRVAFPLHRRDDPDEEIPGGNYDLFIYAGDQPVGHGTFGVRGDRGSDNEDPESNSQRNGNGNGNDND
ncbi:MAG: hypothetical protein M3O34_19420 [Chloroflexota bacterium]|nr:hypothetical protein [Chloroflexota bacterium]